MARTPHTKKRTGNSFQVVESPDDSLQADGFSENSS
jgi:hypothetical protein